MLAPTNPEMAAYQAALEDHATALERTQRSLEQGDIRQDEFQQTFIDTLAHLYQRRIDRGEFPRTLQKAS